VPKLLITSRMQTRIRGTSRCCGGSFAKQVAGNVEKGETATLLRERLEIRLDENLHGLFAAINLDTNGRVAKVHPMASSVRSSNDGVGHMISLERGQRRSQATFRPVPPQADVLVIKAWNAAGDWIKVAIASSHDHMNEQPSFRIAPVRTATDLAATVRLFRAYASSLDIDLSYQCFDAEMEAMPGKYASPAGELLLARDSNGIPVGCVGLRPIEPHGCCEMKRLYVSPEVRGFGLGENLVDAVLKEAERIGYREMRLDTLPSMAGAIALYRKLGFEHIEPYYDTPVIGTIFMRRSLIERSPQFT